MGGRLWTQEVCCAVWSSEGLGGGGGEVRGFPVTFTETCSGAHCSACLGTKLERYGCPRRLIGEAGSLKD